MQYLRDRVVKNFRERLANIIIVDGGLQRMSVVEARLQRHMSIVHLVEQHVQLDLTRGLREVLLTQSFAHSMQNFQPEDREVGTGGEAVCTIADWYVENVLSDAKSAGVLFSPLDKCFKSTRPIGRIAAESVTDLAELKAFVRIFGPYGVDKLSGSIQSQLTKLLGLLEISLRTNKEILEALACNLHNQAHCESKLQQVVELETAMANCLLVGHMLSMRSLLAEATAHVLRSNTPLLFSLFSDFTKHAPVSIPETPNLLRMKSVASQVGAVEDGDAVMLHSILTDMEGSTEQSWALAPFLFVACMTSKVWKSTNFNIYTGGFTTNVYCLSRCINAVIVASEWVRAERKELRRQGQVSAEPGSKSMQGESAAASSAETQGDVEVAIKTAFTKFLQSSVATVLESWDDLHRSPLVAKLVFLDQLCDSTRFLPRSTLETYVPHTIMRSIYQMYYESSVPTLIHVHPSTRQLTSSSLTNGSISKSQGSESFGEANENLAQQTARGSIFSGPIKFSGQRRRPDVEPSGELGLDAKPHSRKPVRFSGPLDYNRKVSFAEGRVPAEPTVATKSPLGRFRSGPLSYV
jgi:NCK-associated protein 1